MLLKDKLISLSKIFTDGFTIYYNNGNINQSHRDTGYYVSINNILWINKKGFIHVNNGDIPNTCFIGGWLDKNTGNYYIDINIVEINLFTALFMAKKYNQKAIWDIKNNKEIKVK